MSKQSCCAHGRFTDGFDLVWVCCELEAGHVGRHQMRQRQAMKEKNWIVVLWDANEPYTENSLGLCPNCAD